MATILKTETRYAVRSLQTGKYLLTIENHKPIWRDTPIPMSRSYASKLIKTWNENAGEVRYEMVGIQAHLTDEWGWKSATEFV